MPGETQWLCLMGNKVKKLFRKLNAREQFLLALVLWAMLFIWFTEVLSSYRSLKTDLDVTGDVLSTQQQTDHKELSIMICQLKLSLI